MRVPPSAPEFYLPRYRRCGAHCGVGHRRPGLWVVVEVVVITEEVCHLRVVVTLFVWPVAASSEVALRLVLGMLLVVPLALAQGLSQAQR